MDVGKTGVIRGRGEVKYDDGKEPGVPGAAMQSFHTWAICMLYFSFSMV